MQVFPWGELANQGYGSVPTRRGAPRYGSPVSAAVHEGGRPPSAGYGPRLELTPLADGSGVALRGILDLSTIPVARDRIEALWRPGTTVTLDVSELEFMDSSGLNLICRGLLRLGDDGTLLIRGSRRIVRRVLTVSGVEALPNVRVEG